MRGLRNSCAPISRLHGPFRSQADDLDLLRGQIRQGVGAPCPVRHRRTSGLQLAHRPLRPQRCADDVEVVDGGAQVDARLRTAAVATQPLAVEELGTRQPVGMSGVLVQVQRGLDPEDWTRGYAARVSVADAGIRVFS